MEYIYILKNNFMPDVVKVGFTTRNPYTRATELGSVTGVPGKFEILHIFPVINGRKAENVVFSSLSNKRLENKEFFKISDEDALFQIERILTTNGLLHSGSDNGIYDFSKYLLKLIDPNFSAISNANDVKSRVDNFVGLFLKLLKIHDSTKIVDFFRDYMRAIDDKIERSTISAFDLNLMFDLFISGYAYYIERNIQKDGFSIENSELIKSASNVLLIFNNRSNFTNNEISAYYCKSMTTQRELAGKYIDDLRNFQKKNNIDWVPLSLDHPTINFRKILNPPESNYHVLKLFGFKQFDLNSKLGEGQVNTIASHNSTVAIFNGEPYFYETVSGYNHSQLFKKIDSQNWIYNWEKYSASRVIFVVIKDGEVVYLDARESLFEKSKGIIKVAFN